MKIIGTAIPGPVIIEPRVFGDDRGFFMESWNAATFKDIGLDVDFVQDNHSCSAKGVLRGLHFQNPNPQGKLVRVIAGSVWDVAVDIRRSSPYFGKWVGVELSAINKRMLWVPPGFAHGFVALEDGTEFLYKCTALYDPKAEHSLLWNDPALGIDWQLGSIEPTLAAKDAGARTFAEIECYA